jgi:hypothetical protein
MVQVRENDGPEGKMMLQKSTRWLESKCQIVTSGWRCGELETLRHCSLECKQSISLTNRVTHDPAILLLDIAQER